MEQNIADGDFYEPSNTPETFPQDNVQNTNEDDSTTEASKIIEDEVKDDLVASVAYSLVLLSAASVYMDKDPFSPSAHNQVSRTPEPLSPGNISPIKLAADSTDQEAQQGTHNSPPENEEEAGTRWKTAPGKDQGQIPHTPEPLSPGKVSPITPVTESNDVAIPEISLDQFTGDAEDNAIQLMEPQQQAGALTTIIMPNMPNLLSRRIQQSSVEDTIAEVHLELNNDEDEQRKVQPIAPVSAPTVTSDDHGDVEGDECKVCGNFRGGLAGAQSLSIFHSSPKAKPFVLDIVL